MSGELIKGTMSWLGGFGKRRWTKESRRSLPIRKKNISTKLLMKALEDRVVPSTINVGVVASGVGGIHDAGSQTIVDQLSMEEMNLSASALAFSSGKEKAQQVLSRGINDNYG